MRKDIERVLLSADDIERIVDSIAEKINEDYKDKNLLLVCVLKGSVCFFSDLMKKINLKCRIDFMAAKSYDGTDPSKNFEIKYNLGCADVSDYDILLVEDIFDSGRTLQRLTSELQKRAPKSVKCCSLLDKPERREKGVTMKLDYCGKVVPNEFVVGYGLDYDELYRNLPYIGVLKPEVYNK